jgi:lysophospholipase L1-like esterase
MKKLIIAIVIPLIFFASLEILLTIFNVEVNTGGGNNPNDIFDFKVVAADKERTDRDINLEIGPQIYPVESSTYRTDYPLPEKRKNEYRIVTIGDSCTYGLGAKTPYADFLENYLSQARKDKIFRVLNYGYPGYSSFQGLQFLKKYIAQLQPDLVIVWFGANDACWAPFYSDQEFYKKRAQILSVVKIHIFLYTHLRLYRILRNINLNYVRKIVNKSFNRPTGNPYKKVRVSPQEFQENLKEIKNLCRRYNSKTLFIWHCWLINGKIVKDKNYKPPSPYIDLYKVYTSHTTTPDIYFFDHCHPNESGHKFIAQEIGKEILKKYL